MVLAEQLELDANDPKVQAPGQFFLVMVSGYGWRVVL